MKVQSRTVVDFKGRVWESDFDSLSDSFSWTTERVSDNHYVYCTPHYSVDGEIPIEVLDDDSNLLICETIHIKDFPSEGVALTYALTLVKD